MKTKVPPMPIYHLAVQFSYEDDNKKKRIYFADFYHEAVKFVATLRVWGEIKPHNGGSSWRIEI